MKSLVLTTTAIVLCHAAQALGQDSSPAPNTSQSPPATAAEVESLRQQVQSLTELVKSLQQQVTEQRSPAGTTAPAATPELPQTAESSPGPNASATPGAAAPALFPTEDNSVVAGASASASSKPAADATAMPGTFSTTDSSVVASTDSSVVNGGNSLAAPITIGGGKNYMNISFDGLFAAAYSSARDLDRIEVGDHDPQQRGFNARNIELAFDGAVDPYFEGFANIVFKLDNDNETEVEVEEAFLQTTNLPFNLQLKAGQFFAAFGRINPTHPHTWDFADDPIVHGRFLGPDGLRGVGAQVSWTIPVPWYSQLIFAGQNGRGSTGFSFRNPGDNGIFFGRETTDREARGLRDFVWIPRWENSVDLSPTQVVLAGVSGAFGSNETGVNVR